MCSQNIEQKKIYLVDRHFSFEIGNSFVPCLVSVLRIQQIKQVCYHQKNHFIISKATTFSNTNALRKKFLRQNLVTNLWFTKMRSPLFVTLNFRRKSSQVDLWYHKRYLRWFGAGIECHKSKWLHFLWITNWALNVGYFSFLFRSEVRDSNTFICTIFIKSITCRFL